MAIYHSLVQYNNILFCWHHISICTPSCTLMHTHAHSCTLMHIHARSCTFFISLGNSFFSRTFHAHCQFLMHNLAHSRTISHNHAQAVFPEKKTEKTSNVYECAYVCMNVHEMCMNSCTISRTFSLLGQYCRTTIVV